MKELLSDQCARVQGEQKYGFCQKKRLQHNWLAFEFPFAWFFVRKKCLSKRLVIHSDMTSLTFACWDILTSPCSLCVQCCRLMCRHDSSGRRHDRAIHQAQTVPEEHANQRPAVPRWVTSGLHCCWPEFLAGKMEPTVKPTVCAVLFQSPVQRPTSSALIVPLACRSNHNAGFFPPCQATVHWACWENAVTTIAAGWTLRGEQTHQDKVLTQNTSAQTFQYYTFRITISI